MGYTHYFYVPDRIDRAVFKAVAEDVRKVAERIADTVPLAGPMGTGRPVFNSSRIAFNGAFRCGHRANQDVVIPWPTPEAGGVAGDDYLASEGAVDGSWHAGVTLNTRTCGGDCSYESFVLSRVVPAERRERPILDDAGRYFDCCKTAFRPYDVLVTAALLILKHHLGDAVHVSSDGEDQHWADAKALCRAELGYGFEYAIQGRGEGDDRETGLWPLPEEAAA